MKNPFISVYLHCLSVLGIPGKCFGLLNHCIYVHICACVWLFMYPPKKMCECYMIIGHGVRIYGMCDCFT